MKSQWLLRLLIVVAGAVVVLVICGVTYLRLIREIPHTDDGRKLADSMLSGKGWRVYGYYADALVNDQAELYVTKEGKVFLFSKNRTNIPQLDTFGPDQELIASVFMRAKHKIVTEKLKRHLSKPAPEKPPSPHAKKLIDSMIAGDEWRIGKIDGCIVNEKAAIAVDENGDARTWEPGKNGISLNAAIYDANDTKHICQAYVKARQNIFLANLDRKTTLETTWITLLKLAGPPSVVPGVP